MTPPPLPDLLRRLAELMPSRVSQYSSIFAVTLSDDEGRVLSFFRGIGPSDLAFLEYALREECQARGWNISMDVYAQDISRAWVLTPNRPLAYRAEAPMPAHALVAAMVKALGGEG